MSILNVMYIRKKTNVSFTPFGVQECEDENIYENNKALLDDRVVIKVDCLQCLEDMFDKGMFINRNLVYSLFSGNVVNVPYGELLASFYKKFPAFSNYIDGALLFRDEDRNLLQNIMVPIRTKINNYKLDVKVKASEIGGRLVLETHDYVYIAFKREDYKELPGIRVEKVIGNV